MPADGVAPLGAETSANTLMTKYRSHKIMEPALIGLISQ